MKPGTGGDSVQAAQRRREALTAREETRLGLRGKAGSSLAAHAGQRKVSHGETALQSRRWRHGDGVPVELRGAPLGADGREGGEHGDEQRSASRAQQTTRGGRGLVFHLCGFAAWLNIRVGAKREHAMRL